MGQSHGWHSEGGNYRLRGKDAERHSLPHAPLDRPASEAAGSFGTVESIKAVSELYSPLSGTITNTNQELVNHPELINKSPYEAGWIVELKASKLEEEKKALLSPRQYQEFLRSLESEHH